VNHHTTSTENARRSTLPGALRVRAALKTAGPDVIPGRFYTAYLRGGTPTSVHLQVHADAAGTSPAWLMTGQPALSEPSGTSRPDSLDTAQEHPPQ
jgi:hypothetical protein